MRCLSISKLLGFIIFLFLGACNSNPVPKIDINKIPPEQSIVGPYTYFVPPYSTYYFHHMDKLGFRLDWVRRSGPVYELQIPKAPFTTTYSYKNQTYTLEEYFQRNAVLGFLILKDNQIVLERYFHDSDQNSRFISNSVFKSITSTLFGIALEDGLIASIDDPVTKYLPDLSMSGYNRVNLRDTLKMSTGIEDNSETFTNPNATNYRFGAMSITGVPSFTDYIKALKANPTVEPGTVFDYESINTQVLGLVIEKVTGMPLNEYMTAKLWSKIGAESDAYLYRAKAQPDQPAFGCFCATLRDYGRFGLMMMNGGILDGTRIVGSSWVQEATAPQEYSIKPPPPVGYGYQWWIPPSDSGAYQATGIFGQLVYVNPAKHIVIVEISAWPQPDPDERWDEMDRVVNAIVSEISQ